jgi:hypothetical protein
VVQRETQHVRKAWATALALVWLRTHARHVEEEWKMLAAKARTWLDDVDAVPPGRGAWVDAASDFLRQYRATHATRSRRATRHAM